MPARFRAALMWAGAAGAMLAAAFSMPNFITMMLTVSGAVISWRVAKGLLAPRPGSQIKIVATGPYWMPAPIPGESLEEYLIRVAHSVPPDEQLGQS